jgi:hypothetical protein
MRLQDLKDRIAHEEYVVDPRAVAEALLRATGARSMFGLPSADGVNGSGVRSRSSGRVLRLR